MAAAERQIDEMIYNLYMDLLNEIRVQGTGCGLQKKNHSALPLSEQRKY